ncbi:MAG: hypothetical protein IKS34_04040 [Clostridia bacterium]|nr:hypothetical protein [Clostridia bacterium]
MEDKLEFRMDPQETETDDDCTILSEKDMNDLDNVELDMDDLKTEETEKKIRRRMLIIAGAALFAAAVTTTVLILTRRKPNEK